jgi:hypothetical protein
MRDQSKYISSDMFEYFLKSIGITQWITYDLSFHFIIAFLYFNFKFKINLVKLENIFRLIDFSSRFKLDDFIIAFSIF